VIVSGPPGAGKSTVAALLAQDHEPSLHLTSDSFFHFIARGYISPWRSPSYDQNVTISRAVAASTAAFAWGGYEVVLDGVIGPWLLPIYREALAGVDAHYAVLRPSLAVALARAAARGQDKLTRSGPVRAMHRAFRDLGPFESHVLDNSAQHPAQTAAHLRTLLAQGALRLHWPQVTV
jgi:cytidylate kinase